MHQRRAAPSDVAVHGRCDDVSSRGGTANFLFQKAIKIAKTGSPPGKMIGPNELWLGSPAMLKRVMSAEERAGWDNTAVHYAELAARFRAGLRPAE